MPLVHPLFPENIVRVDFRECRVRKAGAISNFALVLQWLRKTEFSRIL